MNIQKKTIMHLIATNFYGGPEKQIVEHLIRLDSNKFRGVLASFIESGNSNEIIEKAKNVGLINHSIPMAGPIDFRALWQLIKLIRREKVELLCVHGYKSTVMGWFAGRWCGIPVISFSRGYTAENIKISFYEWLDRQVLKRVDGIISVSNGQKERLAAFGVYGKKHWVVHNAVLFNDGLKKMNQEELHQIVCERLKVPQNSKLIVSAGRLSPEKGHSYFIDAIGLIQNKIANTYFIICGDGVCKADLEKQTKSLGISDRCRFVGFRRDLQDIFQVMDFMVLPSFTEGLPNVVLEAFSLHKPVVATNVGGVPELVDDGKNGLLVLPKNSIMLANAIEKIITDPEYKKSMGKHAYDTVKSKFTFEKQKHELEKIYREMLPW